MKLLICGPSQGVWGGIEAFQLWLATSASKAGGIDVQVAFKLVEGFSLMGSLSEECDRSGVRYHVVERGSRELAALIRWADVVHGQNASPDICVTAALFRRPLVLTIHNHLGQVGWKRRLLWRLCAKLAARRWFNSNFVRTSWERHAPRRFSEAFPTVSFSNFDFSPCNQRAGFVFASRWIQNKGMDTLLEAYTSSTFDKTLWPLHLIGTGLLLEELQSHYQGMPGIYFHGFVSKEEKDRLMKGAKWLVAPPRTNEDMGLTPLEARRFGIPCIVTMDGGLPEVAGAGALLVPPGNPVALREALQKATQFLETDYETLSVATFEEVKNQIRPFSWYTDQYHDVLR